MNPLRSVAVHTLGCKLNFAESSALVRQFEEAGYARTDMDAGPDVLIINTCSVTDHADRKCRNIINRAVRRNPGVYVVVTGCYAQLKPQEIAQLPGVNMVLGAAEKFDVVSQVLQHRSHAETIVSAGEIRDARTFHPSFSSGDRTRTFLKVQDGCNYFCAFCTIPLARGRSRSATIAQTMEEAARASIAGAREIVLTGVNIGDFGTEHGETLLELLVQLDRLEGVDRFRISSIEPNLLSDEIIDFVAGSGKFMPHFHIPLQSGSDELLAAMRRRYRRHLYASRVQHIRSRMPHACIGVDVITGFPGESESHFHDSRDFLMELPVNYLHVFSYSERPGTTAIRKEGSVPPDVRLKRTNLLRLMGDKKKREFYLQHRHQTRPVLWEETEDGVTFGFTDNYIRVSTALPVVPNSITQVRLCDLNAEGIYGVALVPEAEPRLT